MILSLKKIKILAFVLMLPALSWAQNIGDFNKSLEKMKVEAEKCEAAVDVADSICDSGKNKDMASSMQVADMMVTQIGVMTGSSMDAACSTMGKISMVLNGGLAAYKAYCSIEYDSCKESCDEAADIAEDQSWPAEPAGGYLAGSTTPGVKGISSPDDLREYKKKIRENKRVCHKISDKLASAGANIMAAYSTYLNTKNCKKTTSTDEDDMKAKLCAQYPSLPMCVNVAKTEDCSDPTVATTSTVCICISNPSDSRCGSLFANKGGGYNSGNNDQGAGGTDGAPTAELMESGGAGDFSMLGDGTGGGSKIANLNQAGQGGGGRGNMGGGGAAGGGKSGKAASEANTNINAGYGRGGSGGSGSGGGGGGSEGGGGGGYSSSGDREKSSKSAVDLKQFLPGAKMDPTRGIAGIAGPDGITGPNTNIWDKINNRYNAVSTTLLP